MDLDAHRSSLKSSCPNHLAEVDHMHGLLPARRRTGYRGKNRPWSPESCGSDGWIPADNRRHVLAALNVHGAIDACRNQQRSGTVEVGRAIRAGWLWVAYSCNLKSGYANHLAEVDHIRGQQAARRRTGCRGKNRLWSPEWRAGWPGSSRLSPSRPRRPECSGSDRRVPGSKAPIPLSSPAIGHR